MHSNKGFSTIWISSQNVNQNHLLHSVQMNDIPSVLISISLHYVLFKKSKLMVFLQLEFSKTYSTFSGNVSWIHINN